MSEITKEDLKELRENLNEGLGRVRSDIKELGGKLEKHALEDAEREGVVTGEISNVRTRLESLTESVTDRQKFLRSFIAGLVAVAIAAAGGFLIRNAIQVEVAKPILQVPK